MATNLKIERPTLKSEYEIHFASTQSQRGWMYIKATVKASVLMLGVF